MHYTLGIDCGGTFIKAALFDQQGKTTSNCSFGDDEQTLFITCSNSLYRLTIR